MHGKETGNDKTFELPSHVALHGCGLNRVSTGIVVVRQQIGYDVSTRHRLAQ